MKLPVVDLEIQRYQAMGGTVKTDHSGNRTWMTNYEYHRLGGPAIEGVRGERQWFVDGLRHRDDGPAMITPYSRAWYKQGKLHREDGPAVEYPDYPNAKQYWINGKRYTENIWKQKVIKYTPVNVTFDPNR